MSIIPTIAMRPGAEMRGMAGLGLEEKGKEMLVLGLVLMVVGLFVCWPLTFIGIIVAVVGGIKMAQASGGGAPPPYGYTPPPYQYYPPPATPQYPYPPQYPQQSPSPPQPQYGPPGTGMADQPQYGGTAMSEYCQRCGAELSTLGTFCPKCGHQR